MRKLLPKLLIVTSLFFSSALHAQLTVGGIAFTGYNKDDNTLNGPTPDNDFSFVLLQDIPAGQQIFFTDFGWRSDAAAFQTANPCGAGTGSLSDGVIRWQTAVALPRGTHINIRSRVSLTANIGTVTGITATANDPGSYIALGTGGDQIFAYTGTFAAPTLIAGIDLSGAWEATLLNCTTTSSQSVQPAALSTNNYSFVPTPEIDNGRLRQSVRLTNPANAATDRANIHNQANWDFDNNVSYTLPGSLFVLPVNFTWIKAAEKSGRVQVDFGVATEEEVTEYIIERSLNGKLYATIGTLPASRRKNYSWTDALPATGINFYRIKAVEASGAERYSIIANINLSKGVKGILVYPGIVRGNMFSMQINNLAAGNYKLNLHSATGQLVMSRVINHAGGSSTQTVNVPATLQKGIYKISLTGSDNQASTTTMIVQ